MSNIISEILEFFRGTGHSVDVAAITAKQNADEASFNAQITAVHTQITNLLDSRTIDEATSADYHNKVDTLVTEVKALQTGTPVQPIKPADPVDPTAPTGNNDGATSFYVPPTQLSAYLEANPTDPNFAALEDIAKTPTFKWLNGDTVNDPKTVFDIMTNCGDTIPCFSLYAAPGRDNGGPSAGGLQDFAAYAAYVGDLAYQIKQAGNKHCFFVVETDLLGLDNAVATTYPCINAAVDELKANSNTMVFLVDSAWVEASDMAGRLQGAGVERADGVVTNVSGFDTTANCEARLAAVMATLPQTLLKMIDTSRNGGTTAAGDWEDPTGAKLGAKPTSSTANPIGVWVKIPGESDGEKNGWPVAGQLYVPGLVSMIK
jgi:endoglucanase